MFGINYIGLAVLIVLIAVGFDRPVWVLWLATGTYGAVALSNALIIWRYRRKG